MKKIAVAPGDGIGREIMDAVLNIFKSIDVPIEYHHIDMGRDIFLKGHTLGMTEEAKQTVEELGVLFKGPMETPKGGGNKSINVTARKMWGTYANCRRFKYLPGVETIFSKSDIFVDLTIVRENLEDTYGGVEHLLTSDLGVSKRLISAPGCYQIHKYAFEYAKQQGVKTITCGHKANIMKITDGMFLEIFYDVAKDYPSLKANDVIVDDLCMKLVTDPTQFDVVVLPNLQGDIVSDLCAGLVGGLGFAPSANIGNNVNIFEAVHGTAPDIAGKNLANPTALLLSGVMMLNFLGYTTHAKKIEIALLNTLKDKIHTGDLKISDKPVSTTEYADAIIQRAKTINDTDELMQNIEHKPITLAKSQKITSNNVMLSYNTDDKTQHIGLDVFIQTQDTPNLVVDNVKQQLKLKHDNFNLTAVSNRGTSVYPDISIFTECIDNYCIRILHSTQNTDISTLMQLLNDISTVYDITSVEFLKNYNGKPGFSSI